MAETRLLLEQRLLVLGQTGYMHSTPLLTGEQPHMTSGGDAELALMRNDLHRSRRFQHLWMIDRPVGPPSSARRQTRSVPGSEMIATMAGVWLDVYPILIDAVQAMRDIRYWARVEFQSRGVKELPHVHALIWQN